MDTLASDVIVVSVVVPVKNGERFLAACLESLLNQDFEKSWEISVYDDGSTDETSNILAQFAPKFEAKRIGFLLGKGVVSGGVGFAKNRAASVCSGLFFCFCDADDVSAPSRIREQYEFASNLSRSFGDHVFLGSCFTRVPEDSTIRYSRWANGLTQRNITNQIFTSHGPTLIAPTWFLSKSLFIELNGFCEKHKTGFPEDLDFFFRAHHLATVLFHKVESKLVIYRYHDDCASFGVQESSIWDLRLDYLRKTVLNQPRWNNFTIWSAGKQGKRFFRGLSREEKARVQEFCDVDEKKIRRGLYEEYDTVARTISCRIPIVHVRMAFVPVHPDEQKWVDFALEIVKTGGRLVRDAFDQPASVVQTKSSNTDLVTETDQAVEKLLIESLSKQFPDHKFIGEESVAGGAKIEYTDAPTWIIDPIDGTTNFVHRIPMIAICVGLAIKKELRAGIVYNPITRELFHAQVGRGAFKNGFPIHVSSTTALNRSLISASLAIHNYNLFGGSWLDTAQLNMRRQVEAGIRGHRSFGSAAINMIMVAQGCCDAYVEYGLHSWDIAAAAVIVKEAGGVIMDPTGTEFNVMSRKVLCSGTMELAKSLSGILTHAEFDPEA